MLVEERPLHRPATYIPQYDAAARKNLGSEAGPEQASDTSKVA